MPPICAVPHCKSGYGKNKLKCSLFKIPKEEILKKKWELAIPGISKLSDKQFVCEKHFSDCSIIKEFSIKDKTGNTIFQQNFLKLRLKSEAIPELFDNTRDLTNKTDIRSFNNSLINSAHDEQNNCSSEISKESKNELNMCDIHHEITGFDRFNDNLPMDCDGNFELKALAPPPMEEAVIEMEIDSLSPISDVQILPLTTPDECINQSIQFEKIIEFSSTISMKNEIMKLPPNWGISEKINNSNNKYLLLTNTSSIQVSDQNIEILDKYVTVQCNDNTVQYFVHGRQLISNIGQLPQIICSCDSFITSLVKFHDFSICEGIGSIDYDDNLIKSDQSWKDCLNRWHNNSCALLITKNRRCENCSQMRRYFLVRRNRLLKAANRSKIHVNSAIKNRAIIINLKKKMQKEKRAKAIAIKKISLLNKSLQKCHDTVAAIKKNSFEKICEEYKISETHKITLQEILTTAKRKGKHHRYSHDWIMQCMLLNIRSPSSYKFLRKLNIIPLPCGRTIRSYFSLINPKCGFDVNFAKLLKKTLSAKKEMQRHGLIVLDEISLRKSTAVSSANLTYIGLVDFGEDGPKATSTADQATHALVLMFQPLADTYTQAFAVFASKNPVNGKELAKILLKAIPYLENCGAIVHGVISDGASTNKRMATELGVSSNFGRVKNFIQHPLNHERKFFVFSDIPHVIKNIRNRLYNKRCLRIKPEDNIIDWKYFEYLYQLDSSKPGNARACPKLSVRHIKLDNTAKMRVFLATQIFSKSVAKGLQFYKKYDTAFEGCEATIEFCLKINNMFDALNIKSSYEGLTPESEHYKVLEKSIKWLDSWEKAKIDKIISEDEFLTDNTAQNLRLSLHSTLNLCDYMLEKYNFKYILSGKINQDNLEKFFGTVRQAAGCNDHPSSSTFTSLYKILSTYSILKPPKAGNCTVIEEGSPKILISVKDLQSLHGSNKSDYKKRLETLKLKLDGILEESDWDADDVLIGDHDYLKTEVVDCIIYYTTGYLCKKLLQKYKNCMICSNALQSSCVVIILLY